MSERTQTGEHRTWRDYDTHVMQRGQTRNEYFHSTDECPRINKPERSVDRPESFVAFHEPEPCEYCHDGVGNSGSDSGAECSAQWCETTVAEGSAYCDEHRLLEVTKVVTDGGRDTVIVSGKAGMRGNTTYHRDESCGYVQRMDGTVEKPLSVIESHYDPCSRCAQEAVTDGGSIPAAESEHYDREDGFHTCPDCGGELQYQSPEVVVCLDCEADFSHFYSHDGTNNLFRGPDMDLAATVYDAADDQRKRSTAGGTK